MIINKTDGREQRRFFVAMSDDERKLARKNMEELKATYKIPLSSVLRKVILEYINDKDFLEYIDILEDTAVKE